MNVRESLINYMISGIKDEHFKSLGLEVEHFILRSDTHEAVPYAGEDGVCNLLHRLIEVISESIPLIQDKELLGFTTPDYIITLEPASQLEISINATEDISRIDRIYIDFLDKLCKILKQYDYECCNIGTQPVSKVSSIDLIPKERYLLMDRYFEEIGSRGIEMMRGTCSVQVSIDYFSEEDFRNKIQAISFYSPLFKILSDNSYFFEGKKLNYHLARTDIWNRTDKSRCGVLPSIFKENYGFEDYADFLLNMPLIYDEVDNNIIYTGNQKVKDIYSDRCPDKKEIEHIQSMAFPDVRVKKFLEIRSADSMPIEYTIAYCAMIKGLLYSDEGLSYSKKKIKEKKLQDQDIRDTEKKLMQYGWDGAFYGEPIKKAVDKMLVISENNLNLDEKKYLEYLRHIVECRGFGGINNENKRYSC
ncbi:glutamate-cysteine ligase [bacterium]|nr:glutamate-cysteine ligase [bacterium]